MEFLVEFEVDVPDGVPASEVADREAAEASAAAKLAEDGHLLRVWKTPVSRAEVKVLSLYRAESETQLNGLLEALPLSPGIPAHRPADRRHIYRLEAQRDAGARRERRLADRPARRHCHR